MTSHDITPSGPRQDISELTQVCTTRNRPFLIARNPESKQAVFFRPRCKLWSCPACSEVNKSLWAMRAYEGAKQIMETGKTLYFMTVTSHEGLTASQSLWVWPKAWGKLRDRMKYANSGVFYYLMVPEHHQDGRIHVHAIESAGVGEQWLKDAARASGLGYMNGETKLRTPTGSAWYVSKYLTKSVEEKNWPTGFRRIRASQNWPKLHEPEPITGWQFVPMLEKLDVELERYQSLGFGVEVLNHISAWDYLKTSQGENSTPE